MSRTIVFARRNATEILRDPLSYIFCFAFPLVMLAVMTLVNESIPPEAGNTMFRIDSLAGGIAVFGLTFIMLFTAITAAGDRGRDFLVRLYATPMTGTDFICGYLLPMLLIAVLQAVITMAASFLVSLMTGVSVKPAGLLLCVPALLPSALMFASLGLLFGTLFNEKAAPGICSVIISLGSFLGGIWFDAEGTGGVLYQICKAFPFIYCTRAARAAVKLDFSPEQFWIPELIVTACAVLICALSILVFGRKMKADLG